MILLVPTFFVLQLAVSLSKQFGDAEKTVKRNLYSSLFLAAVENMPEISHFGYLLLLVIYFFDELLTDISSFMFLLCIRSRSINCH